MSKLKFYLFGSPRLELGGEPVYLNLRKAMALLVYLVLTRQEHSRDSLAVIFWPESDQSSARANLRRTLYRINKAVGEELLSGSLDLIGIRPGMDIWTDVEFFKDSLESYLQAGEFLVGCDSQCAAVLEEAVGIYADDFLAGFTLPDCPQFDEWQFFESENLKTLLAKVLKQLISSYQSGGKFDLAILHARRWLELDNLHEPAHRLLMRLYAESGQQAAALRQYDECVRILDRDLGLAPQAGTTTLYENIRLRGEIGGIPPAHTRPEVKYVPSGDIHIAYQVVGEGPVDILFVCGFVSHLDQFWDKLGPAKFFEQVATFSRLILFDKRGCGLSDRVGYPPTMENTMDDIRAVMRAANSKHVVLFGMTEGGPNSVLFAATYPELVSGLILYGTSAKWTRSESYPWAITRDQYDTWLKRITENWGGAVNIETFAPSRAHEEPMREWWARSLRLASSPGCIKSVLQVMREIDVREILPSIRCPTLILHRKDDQAIRVGAGRYLAGQIPSARYVELEGQDHWFFVGDTGPILEQMQHFVHTLGSPVIPERMLATILLVEYLPGIQTKSESAPTRLNLDTEGEFLRREVTLYRGSEISWRNHRYTATFDGPSRALHCAKAIQETACKGEIALRVGLHSGECELKSGELGGSAIHIAEGVLNVAGPGEVMASSTVRDLVVGSVFCFTERGLCEVEGIAGGWGIFLVE